MAINTNNKTIVYLPSCVNRVISNNEKFEDRRPIYTVIVKILECLGYDVIIPPELESKCCGLYFENQSFESKAERTFKDYYDFMIKVSRKGQYPILTDYSRCSHHIFKHLKAMDDKVITLMDSTQFIYKNILPLLPDDLNRKSEKVALHITCSNRNLGEEDMLISVANALAKDVVVPVGIQCCGSSADRWVITPEVTKKAARSLHHQIEGCTVGYSTTSGCQSVLTLETGLLYYSIWHLVEEVLNNNYEKVQQKLKKMSE